MDRSVAKKTTSPIIERPKQVSIKSEVQPFVFHEEFPFESASSKNVKKTDIEIKPMKSKERAFSVLYSR
jgi:hypothetical protein